MKFEETVLARRFVIICLISTIFGMGFASLVTSRPAYGSKATFAKHCLLIDRLHCARAS
jgi:hypothetical protein